MDGMEELRQGGSLQSMNAQDHQKLKEQLMEQGMMIEKLEKEIEALYMERDAATAATSSTGGDGRPLITKTSPLQQQGRTLELPARQGQMTGLLLADPDSLELQEMEIPGYGK